MNEGAPPGHWSVRAPDPYSSPVPSVTVWGLLRGLPTERKCARWEGIQCLGFDVISATRKLTRPTRLPADACAVRDANSR